MIKHTIQLLFIVFISCNGNNDNTGSATDTAKPQIIIENKDDNANDERVTGCYMQVLQRDTFTAVLEQDAAAITGRLKFDNYEKDGSTGTVKGTIEGDIIKLTYSFQSEGMNSVMDVYFKKQDDKLIRGIGEMKTRGDTAYFTNPSGITYPPGTTLKKVSCDLVEIKL